MDWLSHQIRTIDASPVFRVIDSSVSNTIVNASANGTAVVYPTASQTYTYSGTAAFLFLGSIPMPGTSVSFSCSTNVTVIGNANINCSTPLSATTDSGGYNLLSGIVNYLVNKLGFNFCVSNSSDKNYFIPAKTTAELQSFVNAIPRLNGVSQQAP